MKIRFEDDDSTLTHVRINADTMVQIQSIGIAKVLTLESSHVVHFRRQLSHVPGDSCHSQHTWRIFLTAFISLRRCNMFIPAVSANVRRSLTVNIVKS